LIISSTIGQGEHPRAIIEEAVFQKMSAQCMAEPIGKHLYSEAKSGGKLRQDGTAASKS
jgi:hypothetical protein